MAGGPCLSLSIEDRGLENLMNRGFYGTLLAVLVTIAALSCIASAKDYSVTAGNWQVDFRTNDTLYTEEGFEKLINRNVYILLIS